MRSSSLRTASYGAASFWSTIEDMADAVIDVRIGALSTD
jgi:hypothetical protein